MAQLTPIDHTPGEMLSSPRERSPWEIQENQATVPSPAVQLVSPGRETESLFEHFGWLYAFCREYLFRDHTQQIAVALWPGGGPSAGSLLLELGCGPGFYACRLAARFKHLGVIGVDCSELLLRRARAHAAKHGLTNCCFYRSNVSSLAWPTGAVDAVIASRLFTVLLERESALEEMHRVLRPGGRCFLAEPRSGFHATLPLKVMWVLARLTAFVGDHHSTYREPRQATVLNAREFTSLVGSQPWRNARCWQDSRYRYAACEKGPPA